MKYKFELYENAGVEEYWIVDPTEKTILQYILDKGQFNNHRPIIEEDIINSKVLKGFSIELEKIFSGFI
jgi:Uma2 family endonuclease